MRVRENIVASCDIVPVLVPDDISDSAETVLGIGGSRFLDAAFLAVETGSLLLSDDLRCREVAALAVGCDGIWMQVALVTATEAKQLSASEYAKAVVGLAERGHDHVALTSQLLYVIARHDRDGFPNLWTVLGFLAGPKAEMQSHRAVFYEFLRLLWRSDDALSALKVQAATGLSIEALPTHRKEDWILLLKEVIRLSNFDRWLSQYVASWLRGHFISKEILTPTATKDATEAKKRRLIAGRAPCLSCETVT